MANYLVTDTQLTSVADAIRTKGGTNSSLAFPSGFTSAIGNIQGDIYDGFGANPELIQTINCTPIKLVDTDWKNLTLSTSSQRIYAPVQIISSSLQNQIVLDWEYTYRLEGTGEIIYTYQPNTEITNGILKYYYIINYFYSLAPGSYTELNSGNYTSITSPSPSYYKIIYTTNNLDLVVSSSNTGLFYNMYTTPSVTSNSGLSSLSTPEIRIATSTTYMTQAMFDKIDENNTTCNFTFKLYKYNKDSFYSNNMLNILFNKIKQDFSS